MIDIKQKAKFYLITFIILAILGILSVIAIPNVSRMTAKTEVESRTVELYKIQTAVNEMLYQSVCGTLEPVGPTSDMSKVCTRDLSPLVLSDYLVGVTLDSGCCYSFAADGTVVQVAP
jgi:Tfp pilus assembly protein PilE